MKTNLAPFVNHVYSCVALLGCLFLTSNVVVAQCSGDIENSSTDTSPIQFTSSSMASGADSATVVNNGGVCGLRVQNADSGQPWARARIRIDMQTGLIEPGDQVNVSIDANVASGQGRVEYVINNLPNSSGQNNKTFTGTGPHNYTTTFTVPSNTTTLDLWIFSNYNQYGNGGDVTYSNINVSKVGANNCASIGLLTEYRINTGPWSSGASSVTVNPGDNLTLSGVPNTLAVSVTDPAGQVHGDNYVVANVTAADAGIYTITESGGCSVTVEVSVAGGSDTQPPATPTGMTASNATSTTVDLSWNAATDNVGVTNYLVYTNGSNAINVGNVTSYQRTGLSPNTTYDFLVRAVDAAGNQSANSNDATISTTGGGNSGTNLALGKTAIQSSTYGSPNLGQASNAVDGNTDGNRNAESITHTDNVETPTWWRVDLGAAYNISKIDIYNRTDGVQATWDRLIGAKVYVGSVDSTDPNDYTDLNITLTAQTAQSYPNLSGTGRYVMVSLPSGNFLSLAEVEVYGSSITDPGPGGDSAWTASSFGIDFNPNGTANGNVGIGTQALSGYRLAVDGKIRTREVRVDNDNWADYVFKPDYELPSLEEVQRHINEKGHLINIPSATEVHANGFELGEMNKLLLEKIEELTLYMIEQDKQQKALERELTKLENNK